MALDEYPEITVLKEALAAHDLGLSTEPDDSRLLARSYRRIRVTLASDQQDLTIAVDDEYDDARDENPELLLHLVLAECEAYEGAADFLVWAAESGFDPSDGWVQALYAELGEVVPRIRKILGPEVEALSCFDFALNAGAAAVLRGR